MLHAFRFFLITKKNIFRGELRDHNLILTLKTNFLLSF